jgi:S1-C subfamily serine protease
MEGGPGEHPPMGMPGMIGADRRGLDGLELATLSPRLGGYFGAKAGVLVVRAGNAGLKLEDGDVITAIDGREPSSGAHATRILRSYQPGEKVAIKVMRDRKALQLDAVIAGR